MNELDLTMKEDIELHAEKAQRQYPAIVYNDALTSNQNVSSEPTVPGRGYTKEIVQDFELRLDTMLGSQVNWVHVLDFARLTEEMVQTLADMMRMVYTRAEGHVLFTSHAWKRLFEIRALRRMTWREFILALGLHTAEEMAEVKFETYWLGSASAILDKEDLRGQAPEKVTAIDLFYLRSMDQGTVNVPYLLAQYLFRHTKGRKSEARMSGGHFIGRLAEHFGLVSDEGLIGLFVIARVLLVINLDELVKLNICVRLGDT
nr:hypothetical protein [Tanacetum cinerariifolium]